VRTAPAKRAYDAAYKAAHREEIAAYDAAYAAAHREERRASDARYCAAHREEKRARDRAYAAAHREERAASMATYREANREAIREQNAKDFAEFTEWLQTLRTNNGCEDCGTHDGRLVHHHPNPATKRYSVSAMCGCSLDTLEDELEKCVVSCRSCHKHQHDALRDVAR